MLLAAAKRSVWFAAVVALWLASATGGLWVLWAYDNKPGIAANPAASLAGGEQACACG